MLVLNVIMILFPIAAILYVSADNPNVLPLSKDVITTSIDYNLEAEDTLKETDPKQLIKADDEMRLLRPSINARSYDVDITSMGQKTIVGVHVYKKNVLNGDNNDTLLENCMQLKNNGFNISGIYKVMPRTATKPFMVLCDMEIRGGGWTYIQKRYDGSQDFNLCYRDYKFGFGDLDGEFWLGLLNIRSLIGNSSSLLAEMTDKNNIEAYAHYDEFEIAPEEKSFRLTVGKFNGTAGDSFANGQRFATYDYDSTGCAVSTGGGWWHKTCNVAGNPNAKIINGEQLGNNGLNWYTFRKGDALAKFRMLIRVNY